MTFRLSLTDSVLVTKMIGLENKVAKQGVSVGAPERKSCFGLHPAIRDFALTGASTFFVSMAAMAVISILGKSVGPALLGEYLLLRRMASWLQAGVQVPSAIALPRFVAFNLNRPALIRETYFVAALGISCCITASISTILLIWRVPFSRLFFGSPELEHLIVPLCLFLSGVALYGVVFGYYQGTLHMGWASGLQTCVLVIAPILATVLLKAKLSIPLIVNTIAVSMGLISCLFAWPIIREWNWGITPDGLWARTSELFSYGFTRILGDVGLQAMLSLPAIIATHYFPIGAVSALLLGGSFLTLVGAASLPLGNILLSRVSLSIAEMRTGQLRIRVSMFVQALIELSLMACLQMIVFSEVIVNAWVGPSFLVGLRTIQITILATPFYFVYAGLRSVIDAAAIKAYNTRNIVVAFIVFLLSIPIIDMNVPKKDLLEGMAASTVIGMVVLVSLSLRTVRMLIGVNVKWRGVLPGLSLVLFLGAVSMFLHRSLISLSAPAGFALFEIVAFGAYFAVSWLFPSSWVRFLWHSMFIRPIVSQ